MLPLAIESVGDRRTAQRLEVLLVESSLEDAGATIKALNRSCVPCRVSLAWDGVEALQFMRREGVYARTPRPDLTLLNLHLAKDDGRQLLAAIRADEQLRRLPVVILTFSSGQEEALKCENLPVDGYMTKPVRGEQFVNVAESLGLVPLEQGALPSKGRDRLLSRRWTA